MDILNVGDFDEMMEVGGINRESKDFREKREDIQNVRDDYKRTKKERKSGHGKILLGWLNIQIKLIVP